MSHGVATKHPFFSIWIAPRSTVRSILDTDPSRGVILLPTRSGAAFVFVLATALGIVARDGLRSIAISIAIDGPIVGLVCVFFLARALAWSGQSFLRGKATDRDLRAALAWAGSVMLWIGALALVQAFVVDRFMTGDDELHEKLSLGVSALAGLIALIGVVLFLKAVGEAHGFSALRSIAATLIALVAFVLVLAVPISSLALILKLL